MIVSTHSLLLKKKSEGWEKNFSAAGKKIQWGGRKIPRWAENFQEADDQTHVANFVCCMTPAGWPNLDRAARNEEQIANKKSGHLKIIL